MKCLIKDLGKVSTGNTPSKKEEGFYDSDDIGFVKPDIISDSKITYVEDTQEYLSENARKKARIVPANSVFVTCIGSIGKIGIAKNREFAFNQQINAIEPNEKVFPEYLAYCLMYNKKQLTDIANAPVVPIINKTQFESFEISIEEDVKKQAVIVGILNQVIEIIHKRQQQLEQLELLIQSRFVEIFGDLIINPKGWELSNFEELTLLITDGEHNTPKRVDKGIYLLSARNILNHKLQLNDVDYIDEREYERIAKRVIPQVGDVLISCSGSVGRCCSVPEGLKFQMVRSVAILRFKNIIRPKFAEYMITSDFIQRQIDASKTASSQANLFQGKIARLKGFVPPMELQMEFEKFISQVEKSKFPYSQSKHSLTAEIIFQNR